MCWPNVQQLTHQAFCGCAMPVGDLPGSGSVSGPPKDQRGSMLELSCNGTEALALPDGSSRSFLEDGNAPPRDSPRNAAIGSALGAMSRALSS
jgi:fumarylacetoacetase